MSLEHDLLLNELFLNFNDEEKNIIFHMLVNYVILERYNFARDSRMIRCTNANKIFFREIKDPLYCCMVSYCCSADLEEKILENTAVVIIFLKELVQMALLKTAAIVC